MLANFNKNIVNKLFPTQNRKNTMLLINFKKYTLHF